MKISDLILELENFKSINGDLEVERYGINGRSNIPSPRLKFKKLLSKRENREDFWSDWEPKDKKGDAVCCL